MCGGYAFLERSVSDNDEPVAQVVRGYCLAVRGSLTNDGRPPLDTSGLKLQQRLNLIEQSLERVDKKGACHNH